MNKSLLGKLKVLEHEKRAFLGLCALFCGVFFFLAIFRNYVDAAFLKRYGVEQIPLMLAINSLATFGAFGIFNRLAVRHDDARLLAGILLFNALAVGLLFWGVRAGVDLCYPALFQLLYLQDSLLLVYLWNIACDVFDSRQGKRLFPLITAAQVLGVVGGNFGTDGLAAWLGRDQLLVVYAVSCLVIGAALSGRGRGTPPRCDRPTRADHRRLTEVPALMRKYPIVRYLVVVGLLPNVLLPIFLYQFSVIVNDGFASEQSLLSFLSLFRGGMTLAVFLLLLTMGRVYERIGVVNASLALPVNLGLVFAALTASFGLYTALACQFMTRLVQQGVAGPVNKVLFNLVPREVAGWTRVFVRGFVVKAGMLAGSLIMLGLRPLLTPRQMAPVAAAIALYWVLETLAFRRHFRRSLKQVIAGDAVDYDRIDSLRLQSQGGLDPSLPLGPDQAPPTADRSPDDSCLATEDALEMLGDPDPLVRAQAAAFFGRRRDMRAVRRLVGLLDDQDMVRNLAVDCLVRYGEAAQPFLQAACLADPRPRPRQAILEVVRLGGMRDFDAGPLVMEELGRIYNRVLAADDLARWGGSPGLAMLGAHLEESNREGLGLIFHALWVRHKDMRLMYAALASLDAPAAVELVEVTLERHLAQLLIPLLEKTPPADLAARGSGALPLCASGRPEAALMRLARSRDQTTRMLAALAMGDHRPGPAFLPAAELLLEDPRPQVREAAEYAWNRCLGGEAAMPLTVQIMEQLKSFALFKGLGLRELEALAAVARPVGYRPGEAAVEAGRPQAALLLVLAGKLVRRAGGPGRDDLGPGDWLGELGLFTQADADAAWRAEGPVEALAMPYGQLSEVMNIYTGIGLAFARHFAARLEGGEATLAVYDPLDGGPLG